MKRTLSMTLTALCLVTATAASAQSVRIPGEVRLQVRKARLAGTLAPAGAKAAAAAATRSVAITEIGGLPPGAVNSNGSPIILAPVNRVETTVVIDGNQTAIDQ